MNCKPGDMAYVVRSEDKSQLGVVVECLHLVSPHGTLWSVRVRGGHACVMTGLPLVDTALIDDSCLHPISGVPVEDEVKDEVPA